MNTEKLTANLVEAFKNLIAFKPYHANEPELDISGETVIEEVDGGDDITDKWDLTKSTTGQIYKHPALRLDILKTVIPSDYELKQFLKDQVSESIKEIFNDLITYRQLERYGKTLLENSLLLDSYGMKSDTIMNQSRFVGLQINLLDVTGLEAIVNEIGLQSTNVGDLDVYLFHSSKEDYLQKATITTTGNGNWDWKEAGFELHNYKKESFSAGVFLIGYYQDDLTGSAIKRTNFDFTKGYCGGCGNNHYKVWNSITNSFAIFPFYFPENDYVVGKMPDMGKIFYHSENNYGLNLRFTVNCDLTGFFIQNKNQFKNLLQTKVVYNILNEIKFSTEINSIEESVRIMIISDLEGDKTTKHLNFPAKYERELKAVSYNISGLNDKCLPCEDVNTAPTIGHM